jgi:hypothetical protein
VKNKENSIMLIIPYSILIDKNFISLRKDGKLNKNICHIMVHLSSYLNKLLDYSSIPPGHYYLLLSIWQDRYDIFKWYMIEGKKGIIDKEEIIKELNKKGDRRWFYFFNVPLQSLTCKSPIKGLIEGPIGISKWSKDKRQIILLHDFHWFSYSNIKATHVADYLYYLQDEGYKIHVELPDIKELQNVQGYLNSCKYFNHSDKRFTPFYYNLFTKYVIGEIETKEDLKYLPLIPDKYHYILKQKYDEYINIIKKHNKSGEELIPLISFNSLICDIYLLSLMFSSNNNLVYYFGKQHCLFLQTYLQGEGYNLEYEYYNKRQFILV